MSAQKKSFATERHGHRASHYVNELNLVQKLPMIVWPFLIATSNLRASYPARYHVTLPLTNINNVNALGPSQSVINLSKD